MQKNSAIDLVDFNMGLLVSTPKTNCYLVVQTQHCNQGYFCDGTHWNTVPEALSQKDASQNSVPELLFFCHQYNEVRRVLLSYHSSF
jgi:hypothetical protein